METGVPIPPVENAANVDDDQLIYSRRPFPWFLSTSNLLFIVASALYTWMAVEDFKWSNELKKFPVATDDATCASFRVQEWQYIVSNGIGGATSRDPSVFDEFSWEDLPVEVQEAYSVLGYDDNIWNSDGTVAVEDMFWSEMTLEQQNAANFLGYKKKVWNTKSAPEDPSVYVNFYWEDLPLEIQEAYGVLGFNENIWNTDELVAVEEMPWSDMTLEQQKAATFLGYTQQVWKDPSHYDDFFWVDIPLEIQEAYGVLGYNETIWNNELPVPVDDLYWSEMTLEQQKAAIFVGYSQKTWDGVENEDVATETNYVSWDTYKSYSWDDLPPEIQDAAVVLGYDQAMWDSSGTSETDSYWWNQLSEEQQKAAAVFGYDQISWDETGVTSDGPSNKDVATDAYDNYFWDDLPPEIQDAAVVLGYDQAMWDSSDTSETDSYWWNQLSEEQQKAAAVFGYDQYSWDGTEVTVADLLDSSNELSLRNDARVSKHQIVYFVAAMLFVFVGLLDVIRERKLFYVLMIFAGLNGVASAVFIESDAHLSKIFSCISVHFFLLEGFFITFHHFVRLSISTGVKLLTFADFLFVFGAFLDVMLSYFWLLDDNSDCDSALKVIDIFAAASWLLCPIIYLGVTLRDYFAFRDELHGYSEEMHTIEEIHTSDTETLNEAVIT